MLNSHQTAIVDNWRIKEVLVRKWYLLRNGYVISSGSPKIYLHHLIGGRPPKGKETEHDNRNKLDCRESNLSFKTRRQNNLNREKATKYTSYFRGVSWSNSNRAWVAQITVNGRVTYLGSFLHQINAAKAYDLAAKKLNKSFARLNFPMRFPRRWRFPREAK